MDTIMSQFNQHRFSKTYVLKISFSINLRLLSAHLRRHCLYYFVSWPTHPAHQNNRSFKFCVVTLTSSGVSTLPSSSRRYVLHSTNLLYTELKSLSTSLVAASSINNQGWQGPPKFILRTVLTFDIDQTPTTCQS